MAYYTLQHTATHCNTLQRIATHRNTCNTLQQMSHVTIMNESCHTHRNSHAAESCDTHTHILPMHHQHMRRLLLLSHDIFENVMSHLWMSHVTLMNELCHTHKTVILPNHVTHKHTSYRRTTKRCVACCSWWISRSWMSHVTFVNESSHNYGWGMSLNDGTHVMWHTPCRRTAKGCAACCSSVMAYSWMSHAALLYESCRTHEWVTSHFHMSHVTVIEIVMLRNHMSHPADAHT